MWHSCGGGDSSSSSSASAAAASSCGWGHGGERSGECELGLASEAAEAAAVAVWKKPRWRPFRAVVRAQRQWRRWWRRGGSGWGGGFGGGGESGSGGTR